MSSLGLHCLPSNIFFSFLSLLQLQCVVPAGTVEDEGSVLPAGSDEDVARVSQVLKISYS